MPADSHLSSVSFFPDTAICIAAHNRRETTLRCLRSLPLANHSKLKVYLVDDGSTDGTSEAVSNEFPDVILLRGNGHLWWGGAMRMAMTQAMAEGARLIVWLNDDFIPRSGALEALIDISLRENAISGGVLHGPAGALSGLLKGKYGIDHIHTLMTATRCDALPGNFVCFPRTIVEQLGEIDTSSFPHGMGDVDYTLRASTLGIPVFVVPGAAGDSADFELSHRDSWFHGEYPILNTWKNLLTYRSTLNPFHRWHLLTRHWGGLGALAFFLPYGKLVLATLYRGIRPFLRLFSNKTSNRAA